MARSGRSHRGAAAACGVGPAGASPPANLRSSGCSVCGRGVRLPGTPPSRRSTPTWGAQGAKGCLAIVDVNATFGVTWVHSYVSEDRRTTFCVYDGPSPEAIRAAAERNGLPVDRICQVRVLDPYFRH